MNTPERQSGFTFIELIVSIALAVTLAAIGGSVLLSEYRKGLTDKTVEQIYLIQQTAQNFYIDTGALPGGNDCANAIDVLRDNDYLLALDDTSPWGTPYTTRCPPERFEVIVEIPDPYDNRAVNALIDASVQGDTVTSSVPRPDVLPNAGDYLSRVDTGNPDSRTMQADILMNGNSIQGADRVEANTIEAVDGNFSGTVDAANIVADSVDANQLDMNDGPIQNASEITLVNGVSIIENGGNNLLIDADELRTNGNLRVEGNSVLDGDVQVNGVIQANDVVTPQGVRLSESMQGSDVLKVRPAPGYSNTIPVPECAAGQQPSAYAVPVRVGGGQVSSTAAMGSLEARVQPSGNNYQLQMFVTDTQNRNQHDAPDGLDYGLVVTRCIGAPNP